MPSRTDSFGIVFLEAWANALPVVAADAGGVPEVVRHEETGLLVPFGDLNRLSAALAQGRPPFENAPPLSRRLALRAALADLRALRSPERADVVVVIARSR